jgi:hypothetical protein
MRRAQPQQSHFGKVELTFVSIGSIELEYDILN